MITIDMDIGDKTIIAPLAKTRIRGNELISLDVSCGFCRTEDQAQADSEADQQDSIPDDETAFILRRWLRMREDVNRRKETALFLSISRLILILDSQIRYADDQY
ncbi:Uncharacterised protein [uncultured archaeon]|nr:Uncharacterised protein [uncultured archaeon]